MKLKKPKFWDYKKPNIYSYLLYPIAILLQIIIIELYMKMMKLELIMLL